VEEEEQLEKSEESGDDFSSLLESSRAKAAQAKEEAAKKEIDKKSAPPKAETFAAISSAQGGNHWIHFLTHCYWPIADTYRQEKLGPGRHVESPPKQSDLR
jgi:hypothetical protein